MNNRFNTIDDYNRRALDFMGRRYGLSPKNYGESLSNRKSKTKKNK